MSEGVQSLDSEGDEKNHSLEFCFIEYPFGHFLLKCGRCSSELHCINILTPQL